jgi:hypothetical protein
MLFLFVFENKYLHTLMGEKYESGFRENCFSLILSFLNCLVVF